MEEIISKIPANPGRNLVTLDICGVAGLEQGSWCVASKGRPVFAFVHADESLADALKRLYPARKGSARPRPVGTIRTDTIKEIGERREIPHIACESLLHAATMICQPELSVLPPESVARHVRRFGRDHGIPVDGRVDIDRMSNAVGLRIFVLEDDGRSVSVSGNGSRAALLLARRSGWYSLVMLGDGSNRLTGTLDEVTAVVRALRSELEASPKS
jgi:hypothetical protein